MKFFQKTAVAWAIAAVMIVAAVLIGLSRGSGPADTSPQQLGLDDSLSTGAYAQWIWDEAEVLSADVEPVLEKHPLFAGVQIQFDFDPMNVY